MKKWLFMLILCVVFGFGHGDAWAAEATEIWRYQPQIEQAAEPLAAQAMQALNDGEYRRLANCMSEQMKTALPETVFQKMESEVKSRFGIYKTKEVMNVELRGSYMIINYKAAFSQTADPVLLQVVLMQENGKNCLGGLWLKPLQLVAPAGAAPAK